MRFGPPVGARQDEVTGIEHVEHRFVVRREVAVDHVLITRHLRAVVAAHRTMVVARRGVVEGADREVQHTEAGRRVAENQLVGPARRPLLPARRHEVVRRQVAHVDTPQIGRDQHARKRDGRTAPRRTHDHQPHGGRREEHEEQRPPGVGRHHRGPLVGHRRTDLLADRRVESLSQQIVGAVGLQNTVELRGHLLHGGLAAEIEELAARHGEEQAQPARDARGPRQRTAQPRSRKLHTPEPLERQRRQQRHRPLHDHEGHRDRAELVVAGKVFIGQFGQSHEVMPPRQQQHDEARRHDPPAVAAADEQHPQQRQEERRGAQIGGPAGVGLFAPVGGKLLRRLRHAVGRQRRGDGAVLREGAGRVAAHEIGNQQVPALGTAVAPRRRIGQIQPAAPGISGRQFRTAARGILRVLGGVPQRCEVRTERQQPCGRQHRRTFGEGFQEFLPQGDDAFAEPE